MVKGSSTKIPADRQLSPKSRHTLATVLGYLVKPGDECEIPHIADILSHWPGKGTLDEYVQLFVQVVTHFTSSKEYQGVSLRQTAPNSNASTIKHYIDKLVTDPTQAYFQHEPLGDDMRATIITDTVLLILGSWTMMKIYFISEHGEQRRILLAYSWNAGREYSEDLALGERLPDLMRKSGLLPSPVETVTFGQSKKSFGHNNNTSTATTKASSSVSLHPSLESLEITAASLNVFKLAHLGAVRILWTGNLSRHMLLSDYAGQIYLELFAIPSALQSGPAVVLSQAGVSKDLMDEVCQSYSNLFNPTRPSYWHKNLGTLAGAHLWCWCLSCSSWRLRNREWKKLQSTSVIPLRSKLVDASQPKYDPELKELASEPARGWDHREFENLWPRIVALEVHLLECKPWNFWVIFRDRRDSVQFWTFLFGTIILIFTFLQVLLGVAQVVSGFK